MTIKTETIEAIFARHGVEFTVEHSTSYSDWHGSSRSVYFKSAFGTVRLSDHDSGYDIESYRYLYYRNSEAEADKTICELIGVPVSEETVAALQREEEARQAERKAAEDERNAKAARMRARLNKMLTAFGFDEAAELPDDNKSRRKLLGNLATKSRRKPLLGDRLREFNAQYRSLHYSHEIGGFRF
jgi:hypothetical protein